MTISSTLVRYMIIFSLSSLLPIFCIICVVLHAALFTAGFSAAEVEALCAARQSAEVKAALKKNTDEAVSAGVFGVPSLVITNSETSEHWLVFGSDRMHIVAQIIGQDWTGPLHGQQHTSSSVSTQQIAKL